MSLTICLWACTALQLQALVPWIRDCYLPAVFTYSLLHDSESSLVFTAGRCQACFTTLTLNSALFPSYFQSQIQTLVFFPLLSVDSVMFLNFCDKLWLSEHHSSGVIYNLWWWSNLNTRCDCVINRGNGLPKAFPTAILQYKKWSIRGEPSYSMMLLESSNRH